MPSALPPPGRAPDKLYEGGLQRQLFLPFIAALKQETRVFHMDSPTDYRRWAAHACAPVCVLVCLMCVPWLRE
jgi:predicted ATPase